ncbi:DUF1329 domain-containing protein [Pseudomonas sp. ZM23]|uniref:DUF1329 domain-containing protein n=1 Tax=Pseudomonas triclosanedens TaxID=2961893 RepID=A0ABY6ZS43_9PSED|nr:DUF1329 domain-containing protein [Pseudomonas triclosanedens]MCP8467092.1 DUF1329 domain-containing protein [Pseudomonas triclosanedens]MCP8472759.1 DUF1329 domain-containing protein [Pseudomonas triclosanedens]MCP8478190.1 DUF1329 domain-containing protein [Pseudomonas triclosanedens]WAI47596.1 DUF1329 domain-containing protein [Pseudomonas triclosanedens]
MPSPINRLPLALALLLACGLSHAKQTDASALDNHLTPLGAERAGNADGSIPAWTGGMKPGAAAVGANGDYADPFAGEQPLYVISKANLDQYKNLLSAGQQAMFARYPDYRVRVFPTHRSAALPSAYLDETRQNLAKVSLADAGNGLQGYNFGVPFAEPTEGLEVMWNHMSRYRGGSMRRSFASATVQEKGDYTLVNYDQLYAFREKLSDLKQDENLLYFTRVLTTSPSRYAGEVTLVQEPLNQVSTPRAAWQYIPGQRRVRRAPTVAYDSSARYSFGQVVADSVDGFNGAPDRYDWKLLGKRELLVGYNAFGLASKQVKYQDMLKPGFVNPDLARYEKHRVWVVEATLKPGARHVYGKRRFYIDEDSWQIMASDIYDNRGELWRYYESFLTQYHDLQLPLTALESTYDLISGRYSVNYLTNEEPRRMEVGKPLSEAEFTPAQLKRLGK